MDADDDPFLERTSFYHRRDFTESSPDSRQDDLASPNRLPPDFIDVLAVAQWREIDFMPITWQQGLSSLGVGGTARLQQSIVNNEVSLAFKRLRLEKATPEGKFAALQAVMTEIAILGHPMIRRLPYFVRLEGICWDFTDEGVFPILVFRKAQHGNLREFLLSEAGRKITFSQRLQICSEIGSAVMTLHSFHMIHGDLKPDNILIFSNELNGYVAKVIDFGYSGLSLERVEDSKFQLPISRPWNAPEVTEWSSAFILDDARKADIYSFGLICLWVLFHNKFPTPGTEDDGPTDDLDWIQTLRTNDLLYPFAMECMEDTESLSEDEIEGLALFFSWTLATEPLTRQLPNETREAAESMLSKQKNVGPFATVAEEEAFRLNLRALSSLGIQCEDIEGHTRPFGFIHYYRSQVGSIDLGYNSEWKTFKLTDAIPQFVASDYRLWAYLKECYEVRHHSSHRDSPSKADSAFQLALLSSLHVGTPNDNNEASTWLLKSGRPNTDLNYEIERIRQVKAIEFKSKAVEIDLVDFVHHYRGLGLLGIAQREYENTASQLEHLFGSGHALVIRLRIISARILQDQGRLRQAEETLVNLAAIAESELGEDGPTTLAVRQQLVSVYIDLCFWTKAESLQNEVLEKNKRVFGEDSEQTHVSMGNLAVIYWNLRQLDKAERLQTEHLELLQRTRGKRHHKTLIRMSNLSSTYEEQGRVDEALKLKLEALVISKEINGEDDHYTVSLMNNIANNYRKRQRFKDAEELDIEVVAARKRQFGENHPITLRAICNLASSYSLQGRPEAAEPLERHVVSSLADQLDPQHQDLLTARNNLSHTLKDLGQMEEAIQMMTDVVVGRTEVLGPDHPETQKSAGNLQLWQQIKFS